MSTIAPSWAQFAGGKGVRGVQELGAALQIVKRGFGGDAGETVTGLQSFLVSVQQHSKQLKKAGVDVFTTNAKTGKKELKGVLDIVDGIANSKLAKNPTKMIKALGRVEAYRAFIQLRDNRAELDKIVDSATDAGIVQRDLDTYTQSAAGRTKIAWQKAKNEIAEAFTPERIERFADLVGKLASAGASIASALSKSLGFVEDIGTGLGMLIYGDTEDMKATKAGNAARDQRVLQKLGLKETAQSKWAREQFGYSGDQYMKLLGASDSDIARARLAIGQEDADTQLIAQGRRLSGSTKSGGYSIAELGALRNQVANAGYTNAAQLQSAIDNRIKAIVNEQTKQLVDAIKGVKTEVKVGADPIATAAKKAPQNARRPGA